MLRPLSILAFSLSAAILAACYASPTSSTTSTGNGTPTTEVGATSAQCTSGQTWTRGDRGSWSMHPGRACITCHEGSGEREAPSFVVAGTVFPTEHEPDDCNGQPTSDLRVVITDATGNEHTLTPTSVGNFGTTDVIPTPFTAKVVSGGKERAMSTPQTNGDCNSCHTQDGANGAPGRITAP